MTNDDERQAAYDVGASGQVEVSDDMLLLGEQEAVHAFFDETNLRKLGLTLWCFTAVAAVYALVFFLTGATWLGAVAGALVVGDLLLLRSRRAAAVSANIRQVCAGVLIGHYLALQLFHLGLDVDAVGVWFLVLVVLAARLRLIVGESVALFGSLYAVLAVRLVVTRTLLEKQGFPLAELVGFAVVALIAFGIAVGMTYRGKRRFLARWRVEATRHSERLRMKQELEYARQIQLSMLPREAPRLPGLDIAALSLPANEVGGDYYDYFPLDEGRLGVVVGDVTGHGVASGLVLSGVRSGLNLLQEDMVSPRNILGRVNRMLKKTSTPRMLMTLGVAVVDRSGLSLTVGTAAHPPVLKFESRNGQTVEVGRGSLPLGAMAETEYAEDRVSLEEGDVVLMYSDGLVETTSPGGEQYGWDRLHAVFSDATASSAAGDIRDAILRDVWDFKGDAEQVDDVTMVVVRIDPSAE